MVTELNRAMRFASILLATVFVPGCMNDSSLALPGSSAAAESEVIQNSRSEIVTSFLNDQISATEKYKAEWQALQGDREPTQRVDIARKLAIAGQLVATDPQNYSSYFAYVVEHMPPEDWELREVALGGLGNSKGQESIELLFKELDDSDTLMIASAVTAIDFRLKTAADIPALQGDVLEIRRRSVEVCRASPKNKHIAEYCEENRFPTN